MLRKTEKIDMKKLEEIMYIYDEEEIDDINWLKNFKTQLKNYDTTVIYKQKK